MKKIFPLFLVLVMLSGCSSKLFKPGDVLTNVDNTVSDTIDLVTNINTGVLYILVALEANTNISSLFFDKTKEKVTSFQASAHEVLPTGRTYYVIPTQVTRDGKTFYDEDMGRLIRNYIQLSGFGKVTPYVQNSDFIVISRMRESIDRGYYKNDSTVVVSIMHKDDIPAFSSIIKLESKADANFWYHPTKNAMPSNVLSMKGLGQIFAVALPQAYGIEPTPSRLEKFEQNMQARMQARKDARADKQEYRDILEAEQIGSGIRQNAEKIQ